MKQIQTTLQLILLAFLCTASHCNKSGPPKNPTLPAITQEGKNTVGFTINGEVWVPYYKCSFSGDPCGEISARYGSPYAYPNNIGFQFARQNKSRSSWITISSFVPIYTTGNKYDSVGINFTGENSTGNDNQFGKSPYNNIGRFEITKLDTINKIISGIFEFTLMEKNGSGRTIEIKDGRFDFKMNACKCSY